MESLSIQSAVAIRARKFLCNIAIKKALKHGMDWPNWTGMFSMVFLARSVVHNMKCIKYLFIHF